MKKLKEFAIAALYAIIIYFVSVNDIFNNFLVTILFDIVIIELLFNPKVSRNKLIISEICKRQNYNFNEDLYDNFYSLQLNEIKFLIYSLCITLPFSNKFNFLNFKSSDDGVLKILDNISIDLLYNIILMYIVFIIWYIIINVLRKFSKYHKILKDRYNNTNLQNKYENIDKEYRSYIGEYSEEELITLNNGKSLISNSHENS